jgi:hypothetical protein
LQPPKKSVVKTATAWDKFDAFFRIGGGFVALVAGAVMLMLPLLWRGRVSSGQLFVGSFLLLAGFVFCVRPLYRMVRGGAWWKVE